MNISNIKPVKYGNKLVAKVSKFPKDVYLGVTSDHYVVETCIELAKELDTFQEILDLAHAYSLNIRYITNKIKES